MARFDKGLSASTKDRMTVSLSASKLKTDLKISQKSVDNYIVNCLHDSCVLMRKYAKNHHHFKNHTGRLERAIKFKVIRDLKVGGLYIDSKVASYGKFVVNGTGKWGNGEYDIPKYYVKGKKLAFFWERLGKFVILSHVKHPGSKGDRVLKNAMDRNREAINYIFRQGLHKLIRGEYGK